MQITKKIIIIVFLIINNNIFCQIKNQNNCIIKLLDSETKNEINEFRLISKKFDSDEKLIGKNIVDCDFNDSILILSPQYDSKLIYGFKDTVYLSPKIKQLEVVSIYSNKKSKKYRIGSKNKNVDLLSSFGFQYHRDLKLVTFFPNIKKKKLKIIEGYIFLEKLDSSLNLSLSFFENKNDSIGKCIKSHINVIDSIQNKGWFRLNIPTNLHLPENGFYIKIQNFDNTENKIFIGFNYYNEKTKIKSYIINTSNNEINFLHNRQGENLKNIGVKLFFIAKE